MIDESKAGRRVIDARAWNPETWDRYADLASFREQHPGLAEGNRALVGYAGPVFVGEHLSNFGLLADFPLAGVQTDLPADIAQVLSKHISPTHIENATLSHPGACPAE